MSDKPKPEIYFNNGKVKYKAIPDDNYYFEKPVYYFNQDKEGDSNEKEL